MDIKAITLEKCLNVLNEMKTMADTGVKINTRLIVLKYHTGHGVPTAAKEIGFFSTTGYNGRITCNKSHFEPIDARTVLEYIYSKSKRKDNEIEIIENSNHKNIQQKYTNIPPTLNEVNARITERGITSFNAESFHAHYSSNGWMVGKSKMKNWDSSLTYWSSAKSFPKNGNQKIDKQIILNNLHLLSITEIRDYLKGLGWTGELTFNQKLQF